MAFAEYIGSTFYQQGYYRVGPDTVFDHVNPQIGNPGSPPPHADVVSIYQAVPYGGGGIINQNNLIGSPPDGKYAQIYGTASGSGGQIICNMSPGAHGNIWIYAKVVPGSTSHVYTYVSNNFVTWYNTADLYVSNTNEQWISCGYYWSNFKYLGIAAINDQGHQVSINIDSAIVVPY